MIKYEVVTSCLVLVAGTLQLTEDQAADRRHNLELLENGTYKVIAPVQFKRGEVIGYDGPKLNPSLVEEVGKAPKKKVAEGDDKTPPIKVIDTVEVVTLADLADALEKSQKETKQILEDLAGYTEAKAGKDEIPSEITQILIDKGLLEEAV